MRFAVFFSSVLIATGASLHAFAQAAKPNEDTNGDLNLPKSKSETTSEAPKAPPTLFKMGDDLDTLFGQLKRTSNESRAKRISGRIWELWQTSDNRSVDLLTTWARAAIQRRQFAAALDLLDQVVTLQPDYAEGWNQRATLHFMMNNFSKSIADIERTLALEPRHFGALSGLANIQSQMGNDEAALASWYKALEVYPAMKNGQKAVIRLEEKLAGRTL